MENLTTRLELTPDQQAKLKPIAEQETNLFGTDTRKLWPFSKGKAGQTPTGCARVGPTNETLALCTAMAKASGFAERSKGAVKAIRKGKVDD
jgi:hypothetical protein